MIVPDLMKSALISYLITKNAFASTAKAIFYYYNLLQFKDRYMFLQNIL